MAGAVVAVLVCVRHVSEDVRSAGVVRRVSRAPAGRESERARERESKSKQCILYQETSREGCVGLHSGGNCSSVE